MADDNFATCGARTVEDIVNKATCEVADSSNDDEEINECDSEGSPSPSEILHTLDVLRRAMAAEGISNDTSRDTFVKFPQQRRPSYAIAVPSTRCQLGDKPGPRLVRSEMDVVEIEGETLSPEEYNDTQGWVVSHERRKKAKDKRNAEPATNAGGGGLDLTRQSIAVIRECVLRAAKVQPDIAGEDTLRINMRQNTMIMSTPTLANAKEYSNIKEIMINDKSYATAAYVTAPENTSKGVIHGIPK
ncbi:hypothetical protein HPB51_020070 [Rhipicephalus microplus]|uniref:Uncharacterized protein n=1 Tax=Rhipicephalus microplus TaxID=6941 RepID=A0A9J6E4C1_RHIMP|nr:hypothetical protein HPB51_020070 [Rhipicephalus microplus]